MTYDERCWQLAMVFVHEIDRPLKTRKELGHELAQKIQATIEEFMKEQELPPPVRSAPECDCECHALATMMDVRCQRPKCRENPLCTKATKADWHCPVCNLITERAGQPCENCAEKRNCVCGGDSHRNIYCHAHSEERK